MTGKKSFQRLPSSGGGTSKSSIQTIRPTRPSAAVLDGLNRNVVGNVIRTVIKDSDILEKSLAELSMLIMHQEPELLPLMKHLYYCSTLKMMTQNSLAK